MILFMNISLLCMTYVIKKKKYFVNSVKKSAPQSNLINASYKNKCASTKNDFKEKMCKMPGKHLNNEKDGICCDKKKI